MPYAGKNALHTTGTLIHKSSPSYVEKCAVAEALVRFGARSVTVSAIARIKELDARRIYKEITGEPSRSGQTPKNPRWFLSSQSIRMQAAFLLLTYVAYRQHCEPDFDSLGTAFVASYDLYQRIYAGKGDISTERFALLIVDGFGSRWRKIAEGTSSDFEHDNIKVLSCRKCKTPPLVEAHQLRYVCDSCQEPRKVVATERQTEMA